MMSEKVIQLRERLAALLPRWQGFANQPTPDGPPIRLLDSRGLLHYQGLPKGGIAELVAEKNSSGSALIIASWLEQTTQSNQVLALIDGADSFNPQGFTNNTLARLLWVRCRDVAQALKAADIVLRDANLPLVLLDLQMNPPAQFRKIPSSVWYRLQRIVSVASTRLLILTSQPTVGSAQVRLNLRRQFGLDALQKSRAELLAELRIETSRNRLQFESPEEEAVAG